MTEFDEAIREFYQQATPSEARLDALAALAAAPTLPKRSRRRVVGALAVVVLIGAVAWAALRQTIPEEIVANHLKASAPTILTADYGALGPALPRLDFTPRQSARLHDFRLVGGRYCSVDGHLAAQLQLRDPRGRRYTLYQVDGRALSIVHPPASIDGVQIETWQEAGIFMGLAGPSRFSR